jgi:hypothetical protein
MEANSRFASLNQGEFILTDIFTTAFGVDEINLLDVHGNRHIESSATTFNGLGSNAEFTEGAVRAEISICGNEIVDFKLKIGGRGMLKV